MILNKTCKKIIQAGLIKYLRFCKDSTKLLFCLIIRFLGNVLPARKAKLPRSWHYVAKLYPDFNARIIHIFPSQYPMCILTYLVIIIIYFLVWRFEQRRHILWCTVITKITTLFHIDTLATAHSKTQTLSKLVAILFQQLVNRMCSYCLFPACWQVVNGLLTTCYKVVELNRPVTSCSNNLLSSCNSTICQQVGNDNLVATW